jgi:hypothetical protein
MLLLGTALLSLLSFGNLLLGINGYDHEVLWNSEVFCGLPPMGKKGELK